MKETNTEDKMLVKNVSLLVRESEMVHMLNRKYFTGKITTL